MDAFPWEVTTGNNTDHRVKTVLQDISSGGGIMRKLNTTKIKKTDDLPFLPERIRKFAFRYATAESKSLKFWAEKYGVATLTISRWLKHTGVRDYLMICQDAARKGESYLSEIKRKLREKRDKMMHS